MRIKPRELEEEPKKFVSPSGSKIKTTYEMRMQKNGHKYLAETGKINIYDRIQDYKDECDVKKIITRAISGDMSAIARVKNVRNNYGDMTQLPQNLMQAQQMIIDGKKAFNQLPKEIREKFNNDPMQFMADEQKIKNVLDEYLKEKGIREQEPIKPEPIKPEPIKPEPIKEEQF